MLLYPSFPGNGLLTSLCSLPDKTFEFVLSNPSGKPDHQRRQFIRSYVMRGKNKKRRDDADDTDDAEGANQERQKKPPRQPRQVTTQPASASAAPSRQSTSVSSASATINHHRQMVKRTSGRGRDPRRAVTISSGLDMLADLDTFMPGSQLPGPWSTPSDLSLCHFAAPVDSYSRFLIFKFLTTIRKTVYPANWCFDYENCSFETWFDWLLSDRLYLEAVLFMTSALRDLREQPPVVRRGGGLGDGDGNGNKEPELTWPTTFSPTTQRLLRGTLKLLQQKIEGHETRFDDTTTAVVVSLVMISDMVDDSAASETHVAGLKEIVRMRGGLSAYRKNRQLQIKLCRVDLAWAIRHDTKPNFVDIEVSWDPVIERIKPLFFPGPLKSSTPEMQALVDSWDYKLRNAFVDLQDFSAIANSMSPGGPKLCPELFQTLMLSIQYRLLRTRYSPADEPLLEALRLVLVGYLSTVFGQVPGQKFGASVAAHRLRRALDNVDVASSSEVAELKLWMVVTAASTMFTTLDTWLVTLIAELAGGQDWPEVRERLSKVMWIYIVHDEPCREIYREAQRQYRMRPASQVPRSNTC